MPYRRNTYDLVVDSGFQPFSMQEMLTPFMMYKDAYDKTEEAYTQLSSEADKFKYLSETLPEGSKSRQLYEGYANELNQQAQDLAANGLSMSNRRALTNLKRRYQGEIGRLISADAAMQEEKKLRRANKDTSMLYAQDNLSVDDFLDGATPNLYGISGEDLRKEAAQYAQAASSRIYGNTQIQDINKYFQDIIQTQGYSPEAISAWRQNLESIPEFNQAVEDIMAAKGVNGNLTGANYERARQNIINGIMEGAAYQEKRQSHQNPGVLTAAQANSAYLQQRGQDLTAMGSSMKWDTEKKQWIFDEELAKKKAALKGIDPDDPNINYDNWEKGPDGKWHRKPKSSTPKQSKVDLLENESYDTKTGYTGPAPSGQNATYGKEISLAEAMELAPDLVSATGDMRDYYKYYQVGSKITRRRVHNSVTPNTQETNKDSQTGNGSNHNAI